MQTRLLSSFVYAGVVLAALVAGGWAWGALIAVAAMIGAREVYSLARAGGHRPASAVGLVLAPVAVLGAAWPGLAWAHPWLAVGLMSAFLAQVARPARARSVEDWAWTMAGMLYPATLLGYLVLLRSLPGAHGLAWTLLLLSLMWTNDSLAYLAGRVFGRRPLFPSLSPKKTVEGAVGGFAGSIAIGLAAPAIAAAVGGVLAPLAGVDPLALAVVGAVAGVVGPAGDLSESFLKRQAGVKDSGDLIPGHGGVLDRVDSTIFAAPVVYYAALWLGR